MSPYLSEEHPDSWVTRRGQAFEASNASWMALVVSTTLGLDSATTVSATINLESGLIDGKSYRLVVQSYEEEAGLNAASRPLGSLQRAVTASQLRRGMRVDLVQLGGRGGEVRSRGPIVIAWVEPGIPNLDFDGRRARPRTGSFFGVAKRSNKQRGLAIELRKITAPLTPSPPARATSRKD